MNKARFGWNETDTYMHARMRTNRDGACFCRLHTIA